MEKNVRAFPPSNGKERERERERERKRKREINSGETKRK
jgi:hypothetical protein